MPDTTRVTWRDGLTFDAELDGHRLTLDAAAQFGGRELGPRPKPMLLSALAGCTGMDVVSILNKMKMPFEGFDLDLRGELTERHPKVYRKIHIVYRFRGKELDRSKIQRAVELSQSKYCGVTAMLDNTAEITYELDLSGA
jgi:putative redox protein